MELLFLLVFTPLCAAVCPLGHFIHHEPTTQCVRCTPCFVSLIPCTHSRDAICAEPNSAEPHHLQKNRIHFFDETSDDDLSQGLPSSNFVGGDDLFFVPSEKEKHKKSMKHKKPKKHGVKHHHHKQKHWQFEDEDTDDTEDSSSPMLDDILIDDYPKHKKHKKTFHFKKPERKSDGYLSSEEDDDDETFQFVPAKSKKHGRKVTHLKKVDSDEEKLEEWLKWSKKRFNLRKDDLLKTLKEASGEEDLKNKKIRLNSPVYELDEKDSLVKSKKGKGKLFKDSQTIKQLSKKEESNKDILDEELAPLIVDQKELSSEDSRPIPAVPAQRMYLGQPSSSQVKAPEEVIEEEMGKNIVFEKPRFNVIPFVPGNKSIPDGGDVISLPFNAAETLVWDWQAVAVASAVVSCLVFFKVVAIYFIINARQWKKVNKTYNKEIEEMSTRIALMHPTLESGSHECHTTSLYLENLSGPSKDDRKKVDVQKV